MEIYFSVIVKVKFIALLVHSISFRREEIGVVTILHCGYIAPFSPESKFRDTRLPFLSI
jgi:hypothetical protein